VIIREYKSYKDYVEHQKRKLFQQFEKIKRRDETLLDFFLENFLILENIESLKKGNILCLGARLGTEVRAWKKLGYSSIGIDLNPGKNNSFVIPADFHYLPFKSKSFRYVYTNSLDHCLKLDLLNSEMNRVLVSGGKAIIELHKVTKEQVEPESKYFESFYWKNPKELISLFQNDFWKNYKIFETTFTYLVLYR